MNAEVNQNHGSGNWIAFLFGAAFNLLANISLTFLLDYALQAIVGGIICLAFKVLGDILSPLWQRSQAKMNIVDKVKKFRMKKRNRNDQA